jgi:saccharopine dehydrogenase-like NADP-dependent oxidoreductase
MTQRLLVVGGSGRIGSAVVRDLLRNSEAALTIAGRSRPRLEAAAAALPGCVDIRTLDLDSATVAELTCIVRGYDLVLLCVGPFRARPPSLMLACISAGVNYVDVCDDRRATAERLAFDATARAAGVTALIDTGTFPGIDNVLVADALARNPGADSVHLHFLCQGSGGGGFGVLQTTFIAVSRPYAELHEGAWQHMPSYGLRQRVAFAEPIGHRPVYGFEVPEIWSLAESLPQLRTVTSRFGTTPDLWNWATWALARLPNSLRNDLTWLDNAATFMIPWVHRLDHLAGEALAIRIDVQGPGVHEVIHFFAPSTTEAVGWATGAAAHMMLDGAIAGPGVLLPEKAIPPAAYMAALQARGGRFTFQVLNTTS